MAQIKNIKKPGDLIRGAKVGVAGLDKDGNVVGTGIDTEDIATFPEGAQTGDVLTWGGDTGPEWRPHYPESGSVGDVLTLGETGPEWNEPGNKKLYRQDIRITGADNLQLMFTIFTYDSDPINTDVKLNKYLNDHGHVEQNKGMVISGRRNDNGYKMATVMWAPNDTDIYFYLTAYDASASSTSSFYSAVNYFVNVSAVS